jgi:hypothetical protein
MNSDVLEIRRWRRDFIAAFIALLILAGISVYQMHVIQNQRAIIHSLFDQINGGIMDRGCLN